MGSRRYELPKLSNHTVSGGHEKWQLQYGQRATIHMQQRFPKIAQAARRMSGGCGLVHMMHRTVEIVNPSEGCPAATLSGSDDLRGHVWLVSTLDTQLPFLLGERSFARSRCLIQIVKYLTVLHRWLSPHESVRVMSAKNPRIICIPRNIHMHQSKSCCHAQLVVYGGAQA